MQKSRRDHRHQNHRNHEKRQLSNSQNFITDRRLTERIVRLAGIGPDDTVLEIGTGKGHLTEALCQRAGSVCSVEIDKKLYESAGKRLAQYPNLKLIHGDFLNYRLPKGKYKVLANIPFFITTQIVDKLTAAQDLPTDLWLVMEKGAAKRFMGQPKETEKSLLLKVNWEITIAFYFRREDFHPMPAVDSVLVHFARKKTPDLDRREVQEFKSFLDHSFRYGVCGGRGLLTKRQVQVALKRAGLPQIKTGGETLYIQWLCLFRCYQEQNSQKN